eukprot:scaffold85169_cov17-Cyclotella_meneghiniana.AAC.1
MIHRLRPPPPMSTAMATSKVLLHISIREDLNHRRVLRKLVIRAMTSLRSLSSSPSPKMIVS